MRLLYGRQVQRFVCVLLLSSIWLSSELLPLLNWEGYSSSPTDFTNYNEEVQGTDPQNADTTSLQNYQQIQNISLLRDFFLNYSKGAAEWLILKANASGEGYSWIHSNVNNNNYTGLANGAAGVGSFFLEVFSRTGNQTYLQYAEGAARWLMSKSSTRYGGYGWGQFPGSFANYTGVYSGAAGIGQFFIEAFRATGNLTYLDYAVGAAVWLNGTKTDSSGTFSWQVSEGVNNYYTGKRLGAAGIAEFFLDVFECTGNSTFWDLANKTLLWLAGMAEPNLGGYQWQDYSGSGIYRTGLDYGAAGIGETFLRAFHHSGNSTFLAYAKGVATWLDNNKDPEGGGYHWRNIWGSGSYYLDSEEGAAGIGAFLLDLFQTTGNQTYLDLARGATQWLLSQTNTTGPGYKWRQISSVNTFYTGLSMGSAGIVPFLMKMYEVTGNSTFLQYARGGAEWLISNATSSGNGYCWNFTMNSISQYVGLWEGTAGIGHIFAELAQASWTNGSITIVEGVADWLISYAYANPLEAGYTWWPISTGGANSTGKGNGAAGIGDFFLDAFERSGNLTYLNYAIGAAEWLIYMAKPRFGGLAWPVSTSSGGNSTGQDAGAAGIGQFFLRLVKATGNVTFLNVARMAGRYLMNIANTFEGGYSWRNPDNGGGNYTGYGSGAAGIGSFFLDLFSYTGNQSYLNYANGAAQWLINKAIATAGGFCWQQTSSLSLNYTGYSEGAAGIGDFFLQLFQATGNETYRNYTEGAARWLMFMAAANGTGMRWPEYAASSSWNYTSLGSGAAGIGSFFLNLHAATGNATYLFYAEAATTWLQSIANTTHNVNYWSATQNDPQEYHTGRRLGTTGIASFFLKAFQATGNQSYLQSSRLAAQWLVTMADTAEAGYRWIEYENQATAVYNTGFGVGAAGIGKFFAVGIDLDLLSPVIGTPNHGTPAVDVPVIVTVPVSDDYAVHTVILSLTIDNGANWFNFTMVPITGTLWSVLIDGQPEGSMVNYTIFANDSMGHWALNDNGGINFSYGFPAVPPVIQDPSIGTVVANSNVTVNVSVTDNVAVHTVILSWDNNTGYGWNNVTMIWVSGTTYQGNVTGHAGGTFIKLQFYANDSANIWGHNNSGGLFFNYTVPFISIVDPKVNSIVPFTTVNINVTVTSFFSVDEVILSWSSNGGTMWFNVTMGSVGGDLYQGPVPGHPEGYEILFQFYANDISGNRGQNDYGGTYFSYTIPATPPTISTPTVGIVAPFSGVQINVTVIDNVVVDTAILSWSSNGGTTWFNITMGSLGSNIYQGPVPGHPEGSEIKYQFYANDSSSIWGKNDSSGAFFSYNIPAIAPIISTPKFGPIAVDEPVTINVSVTDNAIVDAVILSWTDDYGLVWHNVTMNLLTGTTYEGTIPGHAEGTVIRYKVYANDTSNLWALNDKGGALFSYTVTAPSTEFPWLWIVIIGGAVLAIALVVVPQLRGKTKAKASKKKRFISEAMFPTPAVTLQKGVSVPAPSGALVAALPIAEEFEEKETAPGVYTYRGGRIVGPRFIYKVKVKNTTDFIIADVTIHLASYPRECMTLATEEIRHVPKIEPHGFRSLEFELVPQKDCVEGSLLSTVNYVDYKNELRTLSVQPFTLKSVCDLMEPLAIPESAFDSLVKSWARTQEIVTFKGENVRAMIEDVPAIFESKNFHSVAQKIKEDGDNILAEIKGVAVGKYTKRKMALIVQVQANAKLGEGEISCVGLAEDPSMLAACLGEVLVEFRKPLVRQVRRVLKERKGLCEVEVLRQTLKVELPVLADAVRQEKDLTFLQSGGSVASYDYIADFVNAMRKDFDALPVAELEKELKPVGKPMRSIMQDLITSGKVKAAWVGADEFRFKAETHKLIFSVLRYAVAIISGLITIILAIQSVMPK